MWKDALREVVGWYGAAAILIAYALSSLGRLSQGTTTYQVLNLTGALGIVYVSLSKGAYQPGVLNMIWALVALIALIKLLR